MHIHQLDNISDYVRYVSESEREAEILFKELLIGVTNFFREPKAFEILKNKVLPEMLNKKPANYSLRVWIPGCSTGEEAYSIRPVPVYTQTVLSQMSVRNVCSAIFTKKMRATG